MTKRKPSNQELRTRKDLLQAAGRLIRQGRTPTMDEVAEEALVSRATAYRHFPNIDALLVEAPLDGIVADPAALFGDDHSDDPEARIDRAEASMHEAVYRNEQAMRILLAKSVARESREEGVPVRQNRRRPLIEAALSTARHRFGDEEYERLCAALAMIFGPESMIVFRDVMGMDEASAREVKSWAARALVRVALQDSAGKKAGGLTSPG